MFKILALISFVLFSFMAGVIFGAKKNTNLKARLITEDAVSLSDLNPSLKPNVEAKSRQPHLSKALKVQDIKINKPTKPRPTTTNKNKKRVGYTVVLATFRTKATATQHVKEVSQKGLDAFYFATNIKGKTWHRVGVGSFSLRSTAEGLKKELSNKRLAKGSLVSKIPDKIQ